MEDALRTKVELNSIVEKTTMTWILLLLGFSAAAQAQMTCSPSGRIPWIPPTGITVGDPWASYPLPESQCCDIIYPNAPFNAQEKCSLCYNLTKSTPGFAADPNNCQKFFMCEPAGGPDKWNVFPMMCPNCTFWDQSKLTCVEVFDDPDDTGVCGKFAPVTNPVTIPTHDTHPLIFCIDFELINNLATNGVYVYNDGVEVVNDAKCPKSGSRCGHFFGSNSRLEVPLFSNAYSSYPSLRITMYIRKTGGGPGDVRGVISNDCAPEGTMPNAAGNSLYCSVNGTMFNGGLKEPAVDIKTETDGASVVFAELKWTGSSFSVSLFQNNEDGMPLNPQPAVPFAGPIRNSFCPLVIGSFIKEALGSGFEGYMDDICFYRE